KDVKDCPSVPAEVKAFFSEQLDRNTARAKARAREKLLRDQGARGPHIDLEEEGGQGLDEDAELNAALHQSRQQYEFMQQTGPRYERGGGSGCSSRPDRGSGGPLPSMFRRSQSQVPERVRDYHLGLSSAPRQQRIDTGPWTVKGRTSKELLGRAWAKACHAVGIPGRKVDDPYFKAAIIETQKQGNNIYFQLHYTSLIVILMLSVL